MVWTKCWRKKKHSPDAVVVGRGSPTTAAQDLKPPEPNIWVVHITLLYRQVAGNSKETAMLKKIMFPTKRNTRKKNKQKT